MFNRTISSAAARSLSLFAVVALTCAAAYAQSASKPGADSKADAAHYGTTADSTKTATATVKIAAAAPKVGQAAPDFKLPYATQEGIHMKPEEQMSLSSQRGKNVILAFYPADWS